MYIEQCTDDQLKKIYDEFNAKKETVQRDVKTLMEWLEKQPHLPSVKGQWVSEVSQFPNLRIYSHMARIPYTQNVLVQGDCLSE